MGESVQNNKFKEMQTVSSKMVPSPYHNRLYLGCSGSGKTCECLKFLLNFNTFYPDITILKVLIIAPLFHNNYKELVNKYGAEKCTYFETLGDEVLEEIEATVIQPKTVTLLLIDDLACSLSKSKILERLFTTMTRHYNLCISLTSQSIFQSNSDIWRTVVKNAHVIILTNTPRERRSIHTLFCQLFGKTGGNMADFVIERASVENFNRYSNHYYFIYLNLSTDCHPMLRIVYDTLSEFPIAFVPRHQCINSLS